MKLNKIAAVGAAALLLTACSGLKEVKFEDFKKAVSEAKAETYSKASVKVSLMEKEDGKEEKMEKNVELKNVEGVWLPVIEVTHEDYPYAAEAADMIRYNDLDSLVKEYKEHEEVSVKFFAGKGGFKMTASGTRKMGTMDINSVQEAEWGKGKEILKMSEKQETVDGKNAYESVFTYTYTK